MAIVTQRSAAVLPSAIRTTAVAGDDQTVPPGGYVGLRVTVETTLDEESASVIPTIQGKDPSTGGYYDLLAGAAISGVGVVELVVDPRCAAVTNLVANEPMPETWRLNFAVVDTDDDDDPLTYEAAVEYYP